MSVNTFAERRTSILEGYNKVKNDLEVLNTDIQKQVEANQAEVARLAQENKELLVLKGDNTSTIRVIAKMFGK